QLARRSVSASILFGTLPVQFLAEFLDEGRHKFWVHQLVLKSIQDLGFQLVSPHRQQIVASAFIAGDGTAVMRSTDFGEPATTDATFEQTREKVTRSARTLGADAPILSHDTGPRALLPLFDPAPEMVIDYPEVRNLLDYPFGFWIEPC